MRRGPPTASEPMFENNRVARAIARWNPHRVVPFSKKGALCSVMIIQFNSCLLEVQDKNPYYCISMPQSIELYM